MTTTTLTGNEAAWTREGFTFIDRDTAEVYFIRHSQLVSREDIIVAGKARERIVVRGQLERNDR